MYFYLFDFLIAFYLEIEICDDWVMVTFFSFLLFRLPVFLHKDFWEYFIICLSPLILLPFYSWTLFYFLWNSALLPTSLFLSSAPIFRSCSVSLDFVLHCSSSCGSQGSAAVEMHRIAIMVIVIIITILIIVLIIVIVIITSLSWWCSSKFLHNSWMYSLFTFGNLLCQCEKTLFFIQGPIKEDRALKPFRYNSALNFT